MYKITAKLTSTIDTVEPVEMVVDVATNKAEASTRLVNRFIKSIDSGKWTKVDTANGEYRMRSADMVAVLSYEKLTAADLV
jgi:hypothetical protein